MNIEMAATRISTLVLMIAGLAADPAFSAPTAIGEDAVPQSKFHITAEEQTACGQDAIDLCSTAYPDEDKLLVCMKANRLKLSAACRPVFDEGIRRRHLN